LKIKATVGRPRIIAHFAMTADGKISTRNRTPSQFTSPRDKRRLGEIRAECDAVLAGRGTVANDAMSMGLSSPNLRATRIARGVSAVPLRVVISNSGELDAKWKVFQYRESDLLIFSTTAMPEETRGALASACELHLFEAREVPLHAMLAILRHDYGVKKLVCEGGGQLMRSLAEGDLIDEICLTIAPVIFGGVHAPTLTGKLGNFLPSGIHFRLVESECEAGEWFLRFRRR